MRDLQMFANQEIKNVLRNPFCLVEGPGVKLGGEDRWGVYCSSRQIHIQSWLHSKCAINMSDISCMPQGLLVLHQP